MFGEASLRRALREYLLHYDHERNHQGKDNILLFPIAEKVRNHRGSAVGCNERLGGLLKYYNLAPGQDSCKSGHQSRLCL